MKMNKKTAVAAIFLLAVLTASGGCGKNKTTDREDSQVIQISVAPEEVTPTPAPEQEDPAAVTTNGNLTMVNEYLAEQAGSSASDTNTDAVSDVSTDNSGTTDNSDTADDSGTTDNNDTTGDSDGSDEQ